MKHQNRGSALIISLVLSAFFVLSALVVCVVSYVRANDSSERIEATLRKSKSNAGNILSNGQQKVLEAAQVPAMYKDDLLAVIKQDIEGRYGKNGSSATMQWIKERDLNFDPSMHKKVQQLIEIYRDEFKNQITKQLEIRGDYEARIGTVWDGFWIKASGHPKIDLSEYGEVVTDSVANVMKTGRESGPMKLR